MGRWKSRGEAGSESEMVDVGEEDSEGTGLCLALPVEPIVGNFERAVELRRRNGRLKLGRRKVGNSGASVVDGLMFTVGKGEYNGTQSSLKSDIQEFGASGRPRREQNNKAQRSQGRVTGRS
jgi:hypothetical protein